MSTHETPTAERLAEIESIAEMNGWVSPEAVCDLTAEIRRLRHDNHLLSLSRGIPNVYEDAGRRYGDMGRD